MRAIAFLLVTACGAAPNQPILANAPRPPTSAVAGGAAAAAAAITLADPDGATRKKEKPQDAEKKPVQVKESVPSGVLDRLDAKPATAEPAREPTSAQKNAAPKDALDFSNP